MLETSFLCNLRGAEKSNPVSLLKYIYFNYISLDNSMGYEIIKDSNASQLVSLPICDCTFTRIFSCQENKYSTSIMLGC